MNYFSGIQGVGVGLRREIIDDFLASSPTDFQPEFIEIAPENWMSLGGRHAKLLEAFAAKAPLICHGLSLSIGGPHPLNIEFLKQIKQFLSDYQIRFYSEHLSYTHDGGYLYDLLPIPMTMDAVHFVSERILQVQDILGQRLVLENVSTYAAPGAEMSEAEFVCAVLERADCELLLDVNNVYVNSVNHQQDAKKFIDAVPKQRVRYLHMAGHYEADQGLLIDTHGASVSDPVWDLLHYTYQTLGVRPTLLERDFHIPPWHELMQECQQIARIQAQYPAHSPLVDQPLQALSP